MLSPDGDVVGAPEARDGPHALEAVVKRVLEAVRVGVPDAHRAVLGPGQDDGQLGVERHWKQEERGKSALKKGFW